MLGFVYFQHDRAAFGFFNIFLIAQFFILTIIGIVILVIVLIQQVEICLVAAIFEYRRQCAHNICANGFIATDKKTAFIFSWILFLKLLDFFPAKGQKLLNCTQVITFAIGGIKAINSIKDRANGLDVILILSQLPKVTPFTCQGFNGVAENQHFFTRHTGDIIQEWKDAVSIANRNIIGLDC